MLMGFRFPENFNYPYVSTSIREFWRRWHMTLSSWFRDYVYISLGGNRGQPRAHLCESADRVCVDRPVARRGVDLRRVGAVAWIVPGHRTRDRLRPPPYSGGRATCLRAARGRVRLGVVRADGFGHAVAFARAMAGFGAGSSQYPVAEFLDPLQLMSIGAGLVFSLPVYPWLRARLAPRAAGWIGAPALVSLFAIASAKVLSGGLQPVPVFPFLTCAPHSHACFFRCF